MFYSASSICRDNAEGLNEEQLAIPHMSLLKPFVEDRLSCHPSDQLVYDTVDRPIHVRNDRISQDSLRMIRGKR